MKQLRSDSILAHRNQLRYFLFKALKAFIYIFFDFMDI